MNQAKVILQNAKAQFEAQKQKTYNESYSAKYAELKTDYDTYAAEKNKEYTEEIAKLKTAYDAAVAAKRKACDDAILVKKTAIESTASIYANACVSKTDKYISQLNDMLSAMED